MGSGNCQSQGQAGPYKHPEDTAGVVGAGTDRGREPCTRGGNTQNLRHQTDKEVAIWGQRNTEAPREASRHTSHRHAWLTVATLQTPSAGSGGMKMRATHRHAVARGTWTWKTKTGQPDGTEFKVTQVPEG